jgi:glycosyltransferase involved in cell wall biosynthesis
LEEKRRLLNLSDNPVIGAIANIEERKGFIYLIQTMPGVLAEFPGTQLVLIGKLIEREYGDRLASEIAKLGLQSHVSLKGFMPDAGQYFECFDVCVVPSIQSESFGIVAIEAMRYKKPVIATRAGGLQEVVTDGESGFLVPTKNSEKLGEAILRLLRSAELQKTMGQKAFRRFQDYFTTAAMAQRYYEQTFAKPVVANKILMT